MSAFISYSARGNGGAVASSVTSLNTLAGALTLAAGSGITITDNGTNTITISSSTSGTFALRDLSNLTSTAVNASIIPAASSAVDLGSLSKLWANAFFSSIQANAINSGSTTNLAIDAANRTMYANDGATLVLDFSSATGPTSITQSPGNNTTKLATTAFVTAAMSASGITALTGDGTATGPGSVPLTLATVNSNVGSFGSASSVMTQTVNAKGLTTAAASVAIQIAESQVTNLVSDLSGKADLASPVFSGTPQAPTAAPGTNNTQLATTAFVTAAGGSFANKALSNLASVAINADLLPDATANFRNLGSASQTWLSAYISAVLLGTIGSPSNSNRPVLSTVTYQLSATSGAVIIDFSNILGATTVTQSTGNNSTRIATTAFVQGEITANAANKALSNLSATTAVNADLEPATTATYSLGVLNSWASALINTTFTDTIFDLTTLKKSVDTKNRRLYATNGTTITMDYSATTGPISITQSAGDNTTKVATTAFVHTEFATTASYAAPTIQVFTSSSGTYTTPTSPRTPRYLKIRAIGGGGGGGGTGTASGGNGGNGGNTTFGSSLLTANGGTGGASGNAVVAGPAGGTATVTTSGTVLQLAALTGASGSGIAGVVGDGGPPGAATPFGGGGGGGQGANGAGTGLAAAVNTGAGGGAAGGGAAYGTSCSGAAGGFLEAIITSPSATYAYAIGAAGAAGTAGTGGAAGGAGGSGIIIVEEYYQ